MLFFFGIYLKKESQNVHLAQTMDDRRDTHTKHDYTAKVLNVRQNAIKINHDKGS